MQFEIKQMKYKSVAAILAATDKEFTPSLSQTVDIQQYAKKIAKYAKWAICSVDDHLVGSVAFYENERINQLYISYVCVNPSYRKSGIGRSLFDYIVNHTHKFESIALEVNKTNSKAYSFYLSYGFIVAEDRGERLLMIKTL